MTGEQLQTNQQKKYMQTKFFSEDRIEDRIDEYAIAMKEGLLPAIRSKKKNLCVSINGENRLLNIPYIASGGSKRIYELDQDGWEVIALPSLVDLMTWERIVKEEYEISQKLKLEGFRTQDVEVIHVFFDGCPYPMIALKMLNFKYLVNKGIQIRDSKNTIAMTAEKKIADNENKHEDFPDTCSLFTEEELKVVYSVDGCGSSEIFSSLENLRSFEHWSRIFEDILPDITHYFSFGLSLENPDSWNLLIENTENTPNFDLNEMRLFIERSQHLRLFFFDFSSKKTPFIERYYRFYNDDGEVNVANIKYQVNQLLKSRITTMILDSMTLPEIKRILKEAGKEEHPYYVYHWTSEMAALAKETLDDLKPQIIDQIIDQVKNTLENFVPEERQEKSHLYF